ncbi:hypothetical protein BDQ12DRAFT_693584 [Crucibulum laeve]|uniref:Uncharacterized protein n=1 Tax=Crucibulum laeve TaxID=68775 RepID=A0A5C3LG34_9AGAR|nr:hypothetical protein BDQ12DRAFT_693584 [Crucibulum laeve]
MARLLSSRLVTLILAISSATYAFTNPIYIISNAETPSLGLSGLTPVGLQRVQDCIPSVFASLNIGKIVSCLPDAETSSCFSTIATATPLATSLGLPIDTSCGTGEDSDDECVGDLLTQFAAHSTKSIVIVWDLNQMDSLLENLDADEPEEEDDNDNDDDDNDDEDASGGHYDIITNVVNGILLPDTSQSCAGIDGQAPGTFRRSLRLRKKRIAIAQSKRRFNSRIAGKRSYHL